MSSYASLGNMEGCLDTFSKFKINAFRPNTTSINIILAAILYSSNPKFNRRLFFSIVEAHFEKGDLVADRFTYAHILLGCQRAGDRELAIRTFEQFLDTTMRLTPVMRDSVRDLLGERDFNRYCNNLDGDSRKRVEDVDKDDAAFKEKNTFVPGNVESVVIMPAVLGGKRVYNYVAKTEPYKAPGNYPSRVRDNNPPSQDRRQQRQHNVNFYHSRKHGAAADTKSKIKGGPDSQVK